jgi:hypothetical protein
MAELEVPETMHIEAESQEGHEHQTEDNRQPSPREEMMKAIAERAEQRRQEELAQAAVYDREAREAGLAFPEEEQAPEPEPETPAKTPEPLEAEAPKQPVLRRINFEGQQIDVTEEQYEQLARMGMLANVALRQYQQQPQQQQQAQQPQPGPQPAQQQQQPVVDPDLVRQTVRKIQYGGEDDGAQALTELVSHVVSRVPQPQPIDQNQIIQQAAAVAQQQAQFARDLEIIQREYKDTIFNDPQRTMLARLNVDAIRQRNAAAGINSSDLEIFREAGNRVLDALNLPRPNTQDGRAAAIQAAPLQTPQRADVIERKRAAPKTTTTVDRRAPSPPMPRQPTASEIVDKMRQQRGQASMM